MTLLAASFVVFARTAHAELTLPTANPRDAIQIRGRHAQTWRQGEYEMWQVDGGCELVQGAVVARADSAVFWVRRSDIARTNEPSRIIAYLDGRVRLDFGHAGEAHRVGGRAAQSLEDRSWFGRFHTFNEVTIAVPQVEQGAPAQSLLLAQAQKAWRNEFAVRPVQFAVQPPSLVPPSAAAANAPPQFVPLNPAPTVGSPMAPPGAPSMAPPLGTPLGPPPSTPPASMLPPPSGPFAGQPPGSFAPGTLLPGPPPVEPVASRPTARFLKIESRNSVGFNAKSFPGGLTIDTGVRLVAEGIQNVGMQGYQVARFDIEADRVVIWADPNDLRSVGGGGGDAENTGRPIEVYLEGNIVFREGERVIYADRMYYNITNRNGVVLNAELLTPVPETQGLARLKADVLQQLDQQSYQAYGAALTSSRLGVPRYWFQADDVKFQTTERPAFDRYTGLPILDPATGQQATEQRSLATSNNNWVYVGGIPIFYWPTIATDLKEPSYYIDRIQIKNDSVFGTQLLLDFDAYQLFGIQNRVPGTVWQLSTDFLSERGVGLGTNFRYQFDQFAGLPGPALGTFDVWGIRDSGVDNLGSDRRAVPLEEEWRGRLFWQHRQFLGDGYQLSAEAGWISDRNFLEQYYEREWDQWKDQTTGVELKRYDGNSSWSVTGDVRVNDFFTQTNWLPRFDHFLIGQSLLQDRLTWHSHSNVGYAKLQVASTPTNAVDLAKFDPLPWEAEREGVRAVTRHELDWPVDLGPVRIVPYVLGELAHWGEDLPGEDVTRAYGQVGLRASLPLWRADPTVQSELFNLNGVAHKIVFESEIFVADANRDMTRFPLYDPLDDDAIEHFRRRLLFNTFNQAAGTDVPLKFDERFVALRSGMQNWVTSPSSEIADDLVLGRVAINNRWQTKRGVPGQQRIVDWIVFDVGANIYPNADRDNFGQEVGMIDYDFRWHLGDRFTLLSDGFADVFGDGLKTASLSGLITRPEYGSLLIGFRSIGGPIESQVVSTAVNYRMNEKWIVTAGASYDFGPTGNIGQLLNLTRVGESFLTKLGFNWDVSRGNVGATLSIEPRFLPNNRLGRVGGVSIPPAGVMGLE